MEESGEVTRALKHSYVHTYVLHSSRRHRRAMNMLNAAEHTILPYYSNTLHYVAHARILHSTLNTIENTTKVEVFVLKMLYMYAYPVSSFWNAHI